MSQSRALLILGGSFAAAALAAIAPVWTYALSLLLFGLPHVLVELRYVDERFGARLPRPMIAWLAVGLAGIVVLRLLALGGIGSSSMRVDAELLLGAGLVAGTVPLLQRRSAALAALLLFAVAMGTWFDPVTTLVTLALLHNLTPVGFLAERLRGPERRWTMMLSALVFGVLPVLLLTVVTPSLWPQFSMLPESPGPFGSGSLDAQLPAFVPPPLLGTAFADRLFATAAYLQCMHYAVVLHVLPRLAGGTEARGATFVWPRPRTFAVTVVGLGTVFSVAFANDFGGTRAIYAVFAAVHAWLEIPVLVLACGLAPRPLATAAAPA